jgi:two-component system nitrate/nitrite response regulator NarL
MTKKIRVLLVDDHTLFRSGVKSLLQRSDEFEVVDEAGDGLEGIKRARSHKPDVVLLDLHMPGGFRLGGGQGDLRRNARGAGADADRF